MSFNTYNIGDKQEISIKDLANKIMKIMNIKLKIKSSKLSIGSTLRRKPNIDKINKLGYKPKIKLSDGLKKTVSWYCSN